MSGGGRFDFDDGGTYCGGWEDGKAHGHGVCTGPKGQGEYSGAWEYGFEACGVYTWPSGNCYEGQWMQGKRHGLGMENKGHWIYHGEWTQGFKGRYGVRASVSSGAKYEGTWTTGLQDGYGVETYADGDSTLDRRGGRVTHLNNAERGTYQGQWLRGMRHGYGVRQSVPYGLASHYRPKAMRTSLTSLRSEAEEDHVVKDRDRKVDESRGGFVLKAKSDESPATRRRSIFDKQGRSSLRKSLLAGLKLRKQRSTGDIQDSPRRPTGSVRSTVSSISHTSADSSQSGVTTASMCTDSNLSFVSQDDITDINVTETYMGEWKNDKRSGFGISERSDGLKYEGEWYNNKKYGYGVTTFKDSTKEEGKYKNNVLISSGKKSKLFLLRSSKLRERVDNAVAAAQRAAQIAHQKADIAISRMANARSKAEQAEQSAATARKDSVLARQKALEFAPEFQQPAMDCALASSSSQIAENLHKYEGDQPIQATYARDTRQAAPYGGGGGPGPGLNAAPHGPAGYNQNPSMTDGPRDSSNPRNVDSSHHLSANHKRTPDGPRAPPAERLSTLLNPSTVSDHFDQYRTVRDDGGLGRDLPLQAPNPPRRVTHVDQSPASGLSDGIDDTANRPLGLQRRKTMPSIMKGIPTQPQPPPAPLLFDPNDMPPLPQPAPPQPAPIVARTTDDIRGKIMNEPERYVIENGVRKRVKAEVYRRPSRPADPIQPRTILPSRYKLETPTTLTKAGKRGSLPDVTTCKQLAPTVMPRSEVHKLSERRRAEIRRLEEEAERRRQQEIVLRLADFKDWCQQRQLLMLVIALNVSLATMFFNLLSQ